jgi:hypothetical protein
MPQCAASHDCKFARNSGHLEAEFRVKLAPSGCSYPVLKFGTLKTMLYVTTVRLKQIAQIA